MRSLFFYSSIFLLTALSLFTQITQAQILFSESFTVITDTTKTIKGSINPDFKFVTQRKDLLEFENIADISFRFNKVNAITIANKIELSKFGNETLLSGGYLYIEYRKLYDSKWVLEPFAQIQWAEARGLEFKYEFGANARYRFVSNEKLQFFAGTGPFYEYERWGLRGISEDVDITLLENETIQSTLKLGSYLSLKYQASEKLKLDVSWYYQSRFDRYFSEPRLGQSTLLRYLFTEHLGINAGYQLIYDTAPLVPIDKDFHKVIFGLAVSF